MVWTTAEKKNCHLAVTWRFTVGASRPGLAHASLNEQPYFMTYALGLVEKSGGFELLSGHPFLAVGNGFLAPQVKPRCDLLTFNTH